ncbi:MAG TPA: putative quinol monooxygenase [Thermoleophilaceae bacterium]
MVIVVARFRPRPEHRDDLVALLEEVQAASRSDDGCLHYGYYTEITDPLSFIAVEEWRDQEALEGHLRSRTWPG